MQMKHDRHNHSVEAQERAIESKRALLAYIRSEPKRMTMESYLCLVSLLNKAGWENRNGQWHKSGISLSALSAAEHELEEQIVADKDRLLSQTVAKYRVSTE
jgi:hypothetical protein